MAINFNPLDVLSGFNLTKLNQNFQNIKTALTDGLSRSGNGSNQMEADIDLNSNDLLNVKDITAEKLILNGEIVQGNGGITNALKISNALSELVDNGLVDEAVANLGLTQAILPNTPILPAPSVIGRSIVARLTQDWPTVFDWDAQGAVVGGNSTAFTYAFEQAHKSGLSVRLPPSENGLPFLCEPIDLTPQQLKSVVLGSGGSFRTIIQPAGPMDYLFSIGGTLVTSGLYSFEDPNNFINPDGAFIKTYKITPDNLPITLVGISASGGQWVWENDLADSVHWDGKEAFILNSHGFMHNVRGGVGNVIENVRGQGLKYGEVLDADVTVPAAPKQPEGMIFRNNVLLCTQANAIGRWVRAGLDIKSYGCTHGQLGTNGIGLLFEALVAGKAVFGYKSVDDWIESGQNGWAIQSRGNVNTIEFINPQISFGGAVTSVNGIDLEDVQNFHCLGGGIVDPAGFFVVAAQMNNTSGRIIETSLNSGTITETSDCAIKWDNNNTPTGSRALGSSYPDFTTYTPVITSTTGTITTVTAEGRWKKNGKQVTIVVEGTIADNGTGATSLSVTLPFAAKSASIVPFVGYGRENGLTGSMVQAFVGGGFSSATVLTYNNAYPGGTGSNIWFQIEYEID